MRGNVLASRFVLNNLKSLASSAFSTSRAVCSDKYSPLCETKSSNCEITSGAIVTEMKNFSHNVKWLNLLIEDKAFYFKAGQWVDMYIPGLETPGGFSIACPPSHLKKTGCIELAIKYAEDPPAYWIHTICKPAEQVKVRVGGDFYFNPGAGVQADDLLFIAGGLGINPLYSMLGHVQDLNNFSSGPYRAKVKLLYCSRTMEDLIWNKQIKKLCHNNDNIKAQFFLSREDRVPPHVKSGRIKFNDIHAALSELRPDQTKVFLCGPENMMEQMIRHCHTNGFPKDNIFLEKWTKY